MGSDEEYLDDLLKSIMESEMKSDPPEKGTEEDNITEENISEAPVDLDMAIEDDFFLNDFAIQEPDIDDTSTPDMISEDEIEQEADEDDASPDIMFTDMTDIAPDGEEDIIFSDMEDIVSDGETDIMSSDIPDIMSLDEISIMSPNMTDAMSADEIEAMFAAADAVANDEETVGGNEDADAEDLTGIDAFFQSDSDDMGADEMLALLESMSSDIDEEEGDSPESENSSESAGIEAEDGEQNGIEETREKKGILSGIFGKKKKKDKGEKENEEEVPLSADNGVEAEKERAQDRPAKKRNFIINALSFLTESDENGDEADRLKAEHGMEPSDENRNILEELDAEDKKKKKKKLKGKKEEASEDEAENEKKVKEKKKKESKKEKVPKEEAPEAVRSTKPGKKISGKNIAIITALCLTLMALIIVLVSVVPAFFDKREARAAYYESDYSRSYELLYGKKLDDSDAIIYNKSKIVLSLNRKLSSYHNYMSMGRELQALDALMSGVEKYPKILADAEEYNVINEIDAIYATILNILSDKYDISEEVAKVIVDYDDLTYTRKLESIVYKTPFVMPGEENEEEEVRPASPADILPEERDIIGENNSAAGADSEQITLENMPADTSDNAVQEPAEEMMQDSVGNTVEQTADAEDTVPAVQNEGSYGNQGQLIQGIRQPLDIKINGN